MARSGGAWSVKGIDQATRDIAKRAAQASGLTIGEWIDRAILQDARSKGLSVAPDPTAARTGPAAGDRRGVGGVSSDVMAELHRRLDESDARMDAALRPIAYSLHDLAVRLVEAERAAHAAPPQELAGPLRDEPAAADPDTDPVGAEEPAAERAVLAGPEEAAPDTDAPGIGIESPDLEGPDVQGADPDLLESDPTPEVEPESGPDLSADTGPAAPDPKDLEISIPAVPAPPAPKLKARPAPQPPRYDFPLATEGLPDPDADTVGRHARTEETPADAAPAALETGLRPDPVPPRGDLTPDDLLGGLQVGDLQGAERPDPLPVLPEERIAPEVADTAVSDASERPRRSGARTAAMLLAAAVLLLGTVFGAWWFGGGGRITDPDRMMAALGERLAQAQRSVTDAAAEAWHQAQDGVSGLFPPDIASESGPDTGPAPVDPVESAEPPKADLPVLETAETPAAPAPGQPPVPDVVGEAIPPQPTAPQPTAPQPTAPQPTVAPGSEMQPQEPAAVAPEVAETPPAGTLAEAPAEPAAEVPAPEAEAAQVETARAPAPGQDPADVMPPPAPAPAPVVEELAQVPPPPAPAVGPASAAPSGTTPEPTADQSVPAAPVAASGSPEQAPVPDVTSALQDRTAALPPEAPALPIAELRARAIAGDPRAQNDLASRLIGQDPPDVEEAANWFREAAIQGVPGAQYNLGVLYERGLGVRQDETRALLWYHSAAEQGHPLAQYNLGILYAAGRAVPLSYAEAAVWFERAAARGVPAAAYNLAVLLEGGLGRTRDMEQAMAYYARAKELGHRGAAQRLAGETPTSAGDGLLDLAETTSNTGTVGVREIAAIQERLSEIGFYTGAVDGIAGPQTRAAIGRYQASEDLPVTGLPSTGLLRHLQGHT